MAENYFSHRPFRLYGSDRLEIYSLGSERFKTNYITVTLVDEMNVNTVSGNSLIARMLKRGCRRYPTFQALERALEELYGAHINISVEKRGIFQCITASLAFVAGKYVGSNITGEIIKLISEVIFDPAMEDGIFSPVFLEQEKINLIDEIRSRKNDKGYYAVERCEEELFAGEIKALNCLGDEKQIREIDAETLTVLYKRLISSASFYVFLAGQYEENDMQTAIDIFEGRLGKGPANNGFLRETSAAVLSPVPPAAIDPRACELRSTVERMDVLQGKLAIGFRTDILPDSAQYIPLMLANTIMGGGLSSKMFTIIREEHSLAYYASSSIMKYECGIIATCGIDFENRDRVRDMILDILKDIRDGAFSEEELENAKKTLINMYTKIDDSQISSILFNLGQILVHSNMSSSEIIEAIREADSESVAEAACHIFPHNEFFIAGNNDRSGNNERSGNNDIEEGVADE